MKNGNELLRPEMERGVLNGGCFKEATTGGKMMRKESAESLRCERRSRQVRNEKPSF